MILLAAILAVLAAAFAAQAAVLTDKLRVARLELAVLARRLASTTATPAVPAVPSPLRKFECRLERRGLLWFPVLTANDDDKLVSGVASGLPHCASCVQPLSLVGGLDEKWACPGCQAQHPAASADLMATDAVLADCLREFFVRHPDYSPAPGLSAPKVQAAAA